MAITEDTESFKVCIIGQYAVGKTALINRYLTDLFTNDYKPTIANCFSEVSVMYNGKKVSMNIWDTAGQERFQSLTPLFMQDSDFVILVIDITAPKSFNYVENWINNEWNYISPLPKLLICLNKCDLAPTFDLENVAKFASNFNIPLVQASALSGANVKALFQKCIEMLSVSKHRHAYVCEPINEDKKRSCC